MNQPTSNKQLADLAFRQAWQSIFVFAVPAGLAMLIGYYLDNRWQQGRMWTIASLAIALIISWLIIWRRYISFRKIVQQVQQNNQVNPTNSADQPNH